MMTTSKTSLRFAAAAALVALSGAALTAPAFAAGKDEAVPCYGVNACKGQSACKSGDHSCKGQNSCKGQGFKELTAKACADAGGDLTESK